MVHTPEHKENDKNPGTEAAEKFLQEALKKYNDMMPGMATSAWTLASLAKGPSMALDNATTSGKRAAMETPPNNPSVKKFKCDNNDQTLTIQLSGSALSSGSASSITISGIGGAGGYRGGMYGGSYSAFRDRMRGRWNDRRESSR